MELWTYWCRTFIQMWLFGFGASAVFDQQRREDDHPVSMAD